MPDPGSVREMRLVVTADDYDEALRFYRDVLGLRERAAYSSPGGRVVILEAGRATLEIDRSRRTRRSSTRSRSGGGSPVTSGSPSRSTIRARPRPPAGGGWRHGHREATETPWDR